MSEAVPQDVC